VIGHTAHYMRDGQWVGWGPTVKEVNWLAQAFDEIIHLACLHTIEAPESALAYETETVRLRLVPSAGGLHLRDKLKVITLAPRYIVTILRAIQEADVIQVRSPSALAMYAMIILAFLPQKPRWVKYAGNWMESNRTPISFAFQRWWLRHGLSRGPVTVNGHWPGQPKHVYSLDNPSFSLDDLRIADKLCANKHISPPIRLVFIGRLEKGKGAGRALKILGELTQAIDVHLDIIGDGLERVALEQLRNTMGLEEKVTFFGWLSHDRVKDHLKDAHFILLPSDSEGWPKVLSEAMAYGVVPVASNVSAIPQIIAETQCGFSLPIEDIKGFIDTILQTSKDPVMWKQHSLAGMKAAPRFTYEQYLLALDHMFMTAYGSSPMNQNLLGQLQKQLDNFYQG